MGTGFLDQGPFYFIPFISNSSSQNWYLLPYGSFHYSGKYQSYDVIFSLEENEKVSSLLVMHSGFYRCDDLGDLFFLPAGFITNITVAEFTSQHKFRLVLNVSAIKHALNVILPTLRKNKVYASLSILNDDKTLPFQPISEDFKNSTTRYILNSPEMLYYPLDVFKPSVWFKIDKGCLYACNRYASNFKSIDFGGNHETTQNGGDAYCHKDNTAFFIHECFYVPESLRKINSAIKLPPGFILTWRKLDQDSGEYVLKK